MYVFLPFGFVEVSEAGIVLFLGLLYGGEVSLLSNAFRAFLFRTCVGDLTFALCLDNCNSLHTHAFRW